MSYDDVYLENIALPKEAFDKAKKDYEYRYEAAPGIYRALWHVTDKDKRPAFMHELDGAGIKHGLTINYADKRMSKINKILKDTTGMGWKDYLLSEIDRNPILAESEHAVIYDWHTIAVYLWTGNEEETAVLLSEASKAIRKLTEGSAGKLSDEMQAALDQGDVEGYTEQFAELTGTGSKKEIALAFEGAKTLLKAAPDPGLLAAMAAATVKIGTKPLEAAAKELALAGQTAEADTAFNDRFIMNLQRFYQDAMYAGDDWKAGKQLVKRYYGNISEVMKIFGYKVKKMAIMTIIFLFYNDVIEGIGWDSYMDDEDYRGTEWPYTDTDLTFWKKFDPDTVTGLTTGKGGYNPDGEDSEDHEEAAT
ncbi:hypothetical protein [Breznakiella homolactica]|uniref:Uncharacterized protein n=1 Tax=Breznakiella homolactica TaxID=2798577 RepID=A0A7T8BAN1_9SPIR|nr:hypothetical protein [Breznakiella homolactica]QQO10879.1 hypothetical protein JFL75_08170 [Breznakiella homolactica]